MQNIQEYACSESDSEPDEQVKTKDFFGLASSSDEESKSKAWDWDKPENFQRFYSEQATTSEQPETKTPTGAGKGKKRCEEDLNTRSECAESKRYRIENDETEVLVSFTPNKAVVFSISPEISNVFGKPSHNKIPERVNSKAKGHEKAINRIHWCTAEFSHLLLSSSFDGCVCVWNAVQQPVLLRQLQGHRQAIRDAIWSLSGRQAFTASYDCSSKLFDVETGKEMKQWSFSNSITATSAHPGNPDIYLCGSKNTIYAVDQRRPQPFREYKGAFGQSILFLDESQFVSSGDVIARDCGEKAIMAWDFDSSAVMSNQIFLERYAVPCLRKHPSDHIFMAQTHGNYIALFSTRRPYKMNKHLRFEKHQVAGYNIGFDISPDGRTVASGSANGKVYFFNYSSGRVLRESSIFHAPLIQPCTDVKFHPVLPSHVAVSTWNGLIVILK